MEHQEPSGVNTSLPRRTLSSLQEAAKNNWMTVTVFAIFMVLFVSVVSTVILGYIHSWKWTGVVGKTFWDWLKLMIVPIVLGAGGYSVVRAFAWSDQIGQQQRTQEAMRQAQNTSRQASLDQISLAYLDRMESFLTDYRMRAQDPLSELRLLARARTLNVLEALDPQRRGSIIRFLYDSSLIDARDPVLGLSGANLTEAPLLNSMLREAELSGVDLRSANLYRADLRGANLQGANLQGANLQGAHLRGAKVTNEQLADTLSLQGATMPDGSKHP